MAKSQLVTAIDGNRQISVLLALPSADPAGLRDFVKHVSSPGDPLYHQYLTPQQFAGRFGGNVEDYTYLKSWALANDLEICRESLARIHLVVRGSAAQMQKIFKTQLNTYAAPDGQTFYSAGTSPTVPAEIASRISGVIGLTSGKPLAALAKAAKSLGENPLIRSDKMRADAAGGTGPGGTYSAKDLRKIYSIPTFGNLTKNTVIGVFEQGNYRVQDTEVYFDRNNLPNVKQTPIAVANSPLTVEQAIELEACLDIDTLVGINPHISEVLVYIDDYNHDPFNVAMPAAISAVADDDRVEIFSISYGQDEGYQGNDAMDAENTALQQCAAEGITVLASSGDDGAYGGLATQPYNVEDPASQPYVTGVGGSSLLTDAKQNYVGELAWNDLGFGYGATGGGISAYWPVPPYQSTEFNNPYYVTQNGGSSTMRNVPDIAAVADPLTGVGIYVKDERGWVQVGGTSLSCPIWAGYLSVLNRAFHYAGLGNLGFFNPALYAVGLPYYTYGLPSDWLYDIIGGSNGDPSQYYGAGYSNGVGYSNTTGSGSIWGGGFAAQILTGQQQPGTPPRNFWFNNPTVKRTSLEATWATSNGATAYVMGLFHSGPYAYKIAECFVTKETKLTINGLQPNTYYQLFGWSINASGNYAISYPIEFQTP
jgi:kumamolisin